VAESITIRKGQSAVDLALQHYGSLQGLFDAARLNSVSVHEAPAAGAGLATPVSNPVTRYLSDYTIATAQDND
jgi:hypothetical protein